MIEMQQFDNSLYISLSQCAVVFTYSYMFDFFFLLSGFIPFIWGCQCGFLLSIVLTLVHLHIIFYAIFPYFFWSTSLLFSNFNLLNCFANTSIFSGDVAFYLRCHSVNLSCELSTFIFFLTTSFLMLFFHVTPVHEPLLIEIAFNFILLCYPWALNIVN